MKLNRPRKLEPRVTLDMTPLIDCVFQLLLFFMLSSTFVVQSSINIDMPTARTAAAFEEKDLSVTLTYGQGGPEDPGRIYVNDVEVQDSLELTRVLAQARAERPDVMVLIRSDGRIQSERLIEVLGIAKSVGIDRCGIAAQPPEEEQ